MSHRISLFDISSRLSIHHLASGAAGQDKNLTTLLHRRARKLPNPMDFETCQVTRESDRRCVSQLVNIALAVPALEVFSDRQPVEWGLTEVIEQSLALRGALPHKAAAASSGAVPLPAPASPPAEPGVWLQPMECPRTEWRLVVESAANLRNRGGVRTHDDSDAIVWVDHGPASTSSSSAAAPPTASTASAGPPSPVPPLGSGSSLRGGPPPPPPPPNFDELFAAVDAGLEIGGTAQDDAIRALITALQTRLREAIASGDGPAVEAAVDCARSVELPEKQVALEIICRQRLELALESGREIEMRAAVRAARASGADHVDIFPQVLAKQQQLYREELQSRLTQQLSIAVCDGDFGILTALNRVATRHSMSEIATQAWTGAAKAIEDARVNADLEALTEIQRIANEGALSEFTTKVQDAVVHVTMVKALHQAAATDNVAALRAVERRATEEGRTEIVETASRLVKETAARVGDRIGLPAEWDIVLDLAGPLATPAGLLRKTEEKQKELLARMQQLVDETYTGWGGYGKQTRTRDRSAEAIAERLEVKSVVHVQNAENYVNFRARRAAVAREVPDTLKIDWDIKTNRISLAGVGRYKDNPLDSGINEYYLWHGTSPKGANAITSTDFDLKRAGSAYGALFGGGLYFAESSMKSDEYTKADARGWFPFILCRVVLGNVYYCDAVDPVKLRPQLEAACKPGGPGYHSVLGDREKVRRTFREFIVYDNHQVYPEYIVWYARKMV